MKVGINGRTFGVDEPGGAVQASIRLTEGIHDSTEHDAVLFGNKELKSEFVDGEVNSRFYFVESQIYGILWERSILPMLGRSEDIDVLFSPNANGPIFETSFKNVVAIYDVNAQLGMASDLQRYHRKAMVPRAASVADKIVTISEFSKKEIVRVMDIDPEKIEVIYCGVDEFFLDSGGAEPVDLPEKYVLFVGALNPRKNIKGVIEGFEQAREHEGFDHDLVLIGPRNRSTFQQLEVEIEEDIHLPGYVTQGQLKYAYENADAFLYPSFYEGFGLPPLEAMACQTPVIAADTTCFPEVLGEAALLVDPNDQEAIGDALVRAINDEVLTERLIQRGWERAERYRWERAQRRLIEVLEQVSEPLKSDETTESLLH